MKLKAISSSVLLALLPISGVYAAAMDRSGQSVSAFLQPNNYFEAGISILDPSVSGTATANYGSGKFEDMADDYYFPSAAIKLQMTDKLSFGLLYDQPFGAAAEYTGNNVLVSNPGFDTILPAAQMAGLRQAAIARNTPAGIQQLATLAGVPLATAQGWYAANAPIPGVGNAKDVVDAGVAAQVDTALNSTKKMLGQGGTKVDVNTQNLSMIFGFQPTENFNIYGGGVYQTVKGSLNLRGAAASVFNGYDASFDETGGVGWLAGAAFQIPEIALKISATYRSEIEHDVTTDETLTTQAALPLLANAGLDVSGAAQVLAQGSTKTSLKTPQSVNLDLQTGIMADTLAFANVRWVNWKDFKIRPEKFGAVSELVGPLVGQPNGFNIIQYSDDQISATVGVGRKLSEKWSGTFAVGWDSGAGELVSSLGPTEGYWNVGLGAQFSPTPATFIAGGVKYFMLGDAKAQISSQFGKENYIADFEDNDALAFGLKMGYKF